MVATLACWENHAWKRKYDDKIGKVANRTSEKKRIIYDRYKKLCCSVADPDPGPFYPFLPGSGIQDR
jgi:hypothetical protein